ncbi:GATA zinc finger domain-containing protein 7 isoform X3 [Drosophila navojoa]|nr:GATA zinc finger domain-containing protein 7 isoform X3 [Drosophila navojoa]XP_030243278.1 GATA zinc finger domain-containing protein 7 isoform X3 [Drosophila navojoa]
MDSDGNLDDEPVGPKPGPLTTGFSEILQEQEVVCSTQLLACPNCSRTFNTNALRKHVVVCEKMLKKRKVFDSSRQRREGTSLSTYVLPKNFGLPNAEKAPGVHTPPTASREASTVSSSGVPHEASPLSIRRKSKTDMTRASLRKGAGAGTAATVGVAAAGPANAEPQATSAAAATAPPTLSRDRSRASDRSITRRIKDTATEHCPHCERNFNIKAFDRHVEWCKEKAIQANIKSNNTAETNKAKERMEARKKYRPPNLKTKRSINRDKYSGAQEEHFEPEPVAVKQNLMTLSTMTSSVQSDNGLNPSASDKYDPFLSAKRQLEELCSPSTPPDNEPLVRTTATPTVTPTATPTAIMSTSLTSSLGKATSTTSTTASKGTPTSNFRRTSSLRGPRRTPLLPSRPLFATNYRPTIQRGLSDEGPISSNFLKPEEYDEMPVRAACGNDFHSPRVVRRDTSNSNRKQQMKLPLGGDTEPDNTSTSTSKQQQQQAPPARNVAKTDSLAVFLKYEHELEQLNAKAAEVAANSKELSSKDLKDKSNNLSKQNSAKNLNANSSSGQLPPLTTPICPPVAKENNENVAHNFATPLRLDPIVKPQQSLINNSNNNNSNGGGIAAPSPIKLESIFGSNRMADYIDPKLINPCDNLLVQQSSTGSSDASSTPQQLSQSRSSSQSTITMGQEQRRHSGEARNLLKRKMRLGRNQFLYDASPEEAYISSGSCADDEANRSSLEFDEQCWQQQQKQLLSNPLKAMPLTLPNMPVLPTFDDFDFEEFLSSFENENDDEQFPLFRDCREFLLNRTTSRHRSFQKATSTPQPQPQPQSQPQSHTQTQPPTPTATQRPATTSGIGSQYITPPKTHYFASSTKEPHAHRSNSNTSIGNESFKSPQASTGSYKTPNGSGSYKTSPTSAFKSPLSSSDEKLDRQLSNVSGTSSSSNCYVEKTQKSVDESKKREIFISIETEANAQGRSPISPDSLRHMVGNAQTPIDVLHIENGNEPEHAKFSKISDNEDPIDDETSRAHYPNRLSPAVTSPLPNVEANNAKNVIEKMRNDFKQLGEEASASVRRDILQRQEQAQQKQQMPTQQEVKGMTPSPSGDSDELSSLDGYPMSSSQSSRRGGSSKLSTDSAYGSSNSPYCLSRQRSTELQSNMSTPRTPSQLRPHTASGAIAMSTKQPSNMMDASTQAQSNYGTLKARQRMFAPNGLGICSDAGNGNMEYSSSSSEQLMQQQQEQHQQHHKQNTNYNYIQQQQQSQPQVANNNSNSYELNALNLKNNNCNSVGVGLTPTTSQHSLQSNNSNASVKMSKFCHECGAKFVLEHAKFCMECGVRRVVL